MSFKEISVAHLEEEKKKSKVFNCLDIQVNIAFLFTLKFVIIWLLNWIWIFDFFLLFQTSKDWDLKKKVNKFKWNWTENLIVNWTIDQTQIQNKNLW